MVANLLFQSRIVNLDPVLYDDARRRNGYHPPLFTFWNNIMDHRFSLCLSLRLQLFCKRPYFNASAVSYIFNRETALCTGFGRLPSFDVVFYFCLKMNRTNYRVTNYLTN